MRNLPTQWHDRQAVSKKDVEYILIPDTQEEQESNFLDYLNILKRRKLIVIIVSSIILFFGILNAIVEKPMYEATATLLIGDTNPNVIPIQEILTPDSSQNALNTQLEIIKSRAIAEKVVDVLQLDKQAPPEEDPYIIQMIDAIRQFPQRAVSTLMETIKRLFISTPSKADTTSPASRDSSERRHQQVIEDLQGRIDAVTRANTKLVDITLKGRDPAEVVNQVNTVADVFVNQSLLNKLTTTSTAKSWLEKEASVLKEKINKAELLLENFTRGKDYIPSNVFGETQSTAFQRLGSLNVSYVEVNNRRLQLEAQINELKAILRRDIEDILNFPLIADNAIIPSLKKRFFDLQIEYANLSGKLKSKHPKMLAMQLDINETKNTIKSAIENMIDSMQKEYQTLLAKENTLKRELDDQKTEIDDFSENVREYNALNRDLEVNKNLYLEVSRRLAETTLTEALTTNNMRLIEPALTGQRVPSKRVLLVLIHLILGLGFGAVCAFVTDYFDKKFKTTDEVERLLQLPFLGFIPHHQPHQRNGGPITLHGLDSSAAETYRALRTWLQLSVRNPLKSLLITSATPGEGKTTTAVNLAISFAQLGQRVLLVDADLRRPSVYRHFTMTRKAGLADILMDGAEWSQVVQATALENLKILTHGTRPPNPVELFSTSRMKNFIASAQRAFDLVIFDAPVALSIPEVAILAPEMDGVLMVHHPHSGDKNVVLEAKKLIERAGATLIGVVLNNVREKDIRFYYPYRYQDHYAYRAVETPQHQKGPEFIDMKPVETTAAWAPESLRSPSPHTPLPIHIEATSRSGSLSITLHTIRLLDHIGGQTADTNMYFLVIDLTLANYATSPYVFYAGTAVVITDEGSSYDRALVSLVKLPNSIKGCETQVVAGVNTYKYHTVTSQIEGGMIQDAFIPPSGTCKGSLVYQVPYEERNYIFKYVDSMTEIIIPFKNPLGNDYV